MLPIKDYNDKTINILGVDYKVIFDTENNDKRLLNRYGAVDITTKEILIDNNMLVKDSDQSVKNLEFLAEKVLRHEIIHALFYESGHELNYCNDETLVDLLAIQLPKIKELL